MLTTDQKGNIAEMAVTLAAARLGIVVFQPAGEGSRYDLIFDLGTRLLRVQCKWAPLQGDIVLLRCLSTRRTAEGLRSKRYTAAEIDAFAAYCPEVDACYLVPLERVAGQRQMHLRLSDARNGQRGAIVWARDFEFSSIDWASLGAIAQLGERSAGSRKAVGSSPTSSTAHGERGEAVPTMGSHQFRNHFGYYLDQVAAGKHFLITRRGRPYARISPAEPVGERDPTQPTDRAGASPQSCSRR